VRRRNATETLVTGLLVIGLIAGGAASGLGAGVLSGIAQVLPDALRVALVVLLALAVIARDFRIVPIELPQNARQVPQSIFGRGRERAALRFGFELGTGLRTYATSSAPHLLALTTLLFAPGLGVALAAGASFGAGRAAMPVLRRWSRDAAGWDQRMARHERRVISIAAIIALCLVGTLVTTYA
jgi:hypothetical protein